MKVGFPFTRSASANGSFFLMSIFITFALSPRAAATSRKVSKLLSASSQSK
jgi:hypothetical protein